MIKSVFGLLAGILFSTCPQAQPSAELEGVQLENNQWRISIPIDEVENVFGLQAELSFQDNNIEILSAKFKHHQNWPKQGKVELRNSIKENHALYAVSLIRPAREIDLDGVALQFDIKLKEFKPTKIILNKLKVSNIKGNVTNFTIENRNLIIGKKVTLWPYYLLVIAFLILIFSIIFKLKSKLKSANIKIAAA